MDLKRGWRVGGWGGGVMGALSGVSWRSSAGRKRGSLFTNVLICKITRIWILFEKKKKFSPHHCCDCGLSVNSSLSSLGSCTEDSYCLLWNHFRPIYSEGQLRCYLLINACQYQQQVSLCVEVRATECKGQVHKARREDWEIS